MEELGSAFLLAFGLVEIVVLGVLAFLLIKSKSYRQAHEEAIELASTRGLLVQDLKHQIQRLEERVAHLEMQSEVLSGLKADAIAERVAEFLRREEHPFSG
jgi:high-affinity nickel permease